MVINSFGMYIGKTLERITHKESPWADAYDGDNVCGYTNEPITKGAIRDYFKSISLEYDLTTERRFVRIYSEAISLLKQACDLTGNVSEVNH